MEAVVCRYCPYLLRVKNLLVHDWSILCPALAASVIGATIALASGGVELYDLPVACSLVCIIITNFHC